jgi:hypothetical protein
VADGQGRERQKGQFLAPEDRKRDRQNRRRESGRSLTDRREFRIHNLVADMRSRLFMRELAIRVEFDATKLQRPAGGEGERRRRGLWARRWRERLWRRAWTGVQETHMNPPRRFRQSERDRIQGSQRVWKTLGGIHGLCLRRPGFIRPAAARTSVCGGRTMAAAAGLDAERGFASLSDQVWQRWLRVVEAKASMRSPVENLMLPLAFYENGRRRRAVLRAKSGAVMGEEMVFAESCA